MSRPSATQIAASGEKIIEQEQIRLRTRPRLSLHCDSLLHQLATRVLDPTRTPYFRKAIHRQRQFRQRRLTVPSLQIRSVSQMLDDAAYKQLVDLTANQSQHFAP